MICSQISETLVRQTYFKREMGQDVVGERDKIKVYRALSGKLRNLDFILILIENKLKLWNDII